MGQEGAKKAAGDEASRLVQSGMVVGLGTGSTAKYFIEALAKRIKEGLSVKCAATSIETEQLATRLGLTLIPIESAVHFDLDVDGADQIDANKNMIKGGGGALLREKIFAHSCTEMIVLIDKTKQTKHLGNIPLPVEILPFGYNLTIASIEKLGVTGSIRKKEGSFFITDNANYIFDIELKAGVDIKTLNTNLLNIPGLLETGLFIGYAGRVILGNEDGSCLIY